MDVHICKMAQFHRNRSLMHFSDEDSSTICRLSLHQTRIHCIYLLHLHSSKVQVHHPWTGILILHVDHVAKFVSSSTIESRNHVLSDDYLFVYHQLVISPRLRPSPVTKDDGGRETSRLRFKAHLVNWIWRNGNLEDCKRDKEAPGNNSGFISIIRLGKFFLCSCYLNLTSLHLISLLLAIRWTIYSRTNGWKVDATKRVWQWLN